MKGGRPADEPAKGPADGSATGPAADRRWETRLSPRIVTYLVVAAIGLLSGVLFRRIDAVVLAAPLALVLVAGLSSSRHPPLRIGVSVDRERFVEGDELVLAVRLESTETVDRVELMVEVPDGLIAAGPNPVALWVRAGEERVWTLPMRCVRWGTYSVGDLAVRVRDRSGLSIHQRRVPPGIVVRVHPGVETVRTLVRPRRTQAVAGSQVARHVGAGIEPADMRLYVPGDRVREVNWRTTARRGALWVNQRHPESATDVVVFLDTFSAATFAAAVRVAITLVQAYLADRDRVGLVAFGGTVSWVRPGMGATQQHRMVDHLLGTRVRESFVWKGLDVVPRHTLPPHALVVAVTSLEDDRAIAALADLRNRGIDLAVVEVTPEGAVRPAPDGSQELARRLWGMRRQVVRDRYQRLGVAVVEWRHDRAVEDVLAEMQAFRRHGHRMLR